MTYQSITILIIGFLLPCLLTAQNNNGQIDALEELGTKETIQIPLAGGATLATDIFMPYTSDSLALDLNILGQQVYVEVIPKGTQLVVYPEMLDSAGNAVPNPNPYQLPFLLSRTPYGADGIGAVGSAIPLLGYAFVNQDTRGRGASGGVNLPLYSDSWKKSPYNNTAHLLDITPVGDPANSLEHEDGWTTYQYVLNQYQKDFDLDGDGLVDTTAPACNGTIGGVGASAFAMPQLQLAASHRIDPTQPGLKSLAAFIATTEHYNCTAYNNGVFRQNLVQEWLGGQFNDLNDTITDGDLQNNIHTPSDYNQLTKEAVADLATHHVSDYKYPTSAVANAYPNSVGRPEMDVSFAPVNALGEGDINGTFSRYTNMDIPSYHLTGWYDIFINGQIATYQNMRQHLTSMNKNRQKIVIGPWAHTTITTLNTGDRTYPDNVGDVVGIGIDIDDPISSSNLNIQELLQIELVSWFRYTMNENGHVRLGEPKIRIPESQNWQNVGAFSVRVPAENYDIELADFFNFLIGASDLPNFPIEIDLGFGQVISNSINIPSVAGVFPISDPIQSPTVVDFENDIPNVRFYVMGPDEASTQNVGVGNYWYHSEQFPLDTPDVEYHNIYLHQNQNIDFAVPTVDEGELTYAHDPNDPVQTVGGNNLSLKTPDDRDSHGQLNLADSTWVDLTMNHPGVIQFETEELEDTLSMIGFPKAKLYVKSEPVGMSSGETDTDFFVRIVDVHPDGREFYVVEGAVSGRARAYAASIYDGAENPNAAYANMNIGEVHELKFELLPIAYTFGKGHKMKVLISSSNYPRYQSTANLPMEDGDFFRRRPNDGKTYTFQGQAMSPRIANNSILFSPDYPSQLNLPLKGYIPEVNTSVYPIETTTTADFQVLPNPVEDICTVQFEMEAKRQISLYNNLGQLISVYQVTDKQFQLNMEDLAAGIYRLEVLDLDQNRQSSSSIHKK